jgi:FkbM family methyltransferase
VSEAPSAEVFWHDQAKMWWPVADRDPVKAWAFVEKRAGDSAAAVRLCRKRRTCVQAGGYVGLWPLALAKSFARVITFEVMPGMLEACRRNCAKAANVSVYGVGLGAAMGSAPLQPTSTAGSWRIDPEGPLSCDLITIDSLALADCDAIILDVEGYEVEVLRGAADTIARCAPVIQVEELDRSAAAIRRHLAGLGYREAARVRKDGIYVRA